MDGFPSGYRVVHFIRNPVAAVISGYLYHRDVSGVITAGDYGASQATTFVVSKELLPLIRTNETYSSFLRHVSVEEGLHAELERFHRLEMEEWAAGVSQCRANPELCTTVCLEEFGYDYLGTWSKVIGFAGHNLSAYPELLDILSTYDAHLHPTEHATSKRVSAEERVQMAHQVQEIDTLFFGGRLAELPQEVHACGAPAADERRSEMAIQGNVDSYS